MAVLVGHPLPVVILSGVFASASSSGGLSPDMDQSKVWVGLRRRLPSGQRRMFAHRCLSHWWGLPALAWWWIGSLPVEFRWATTMVLVGWVSHLVGDFVFGRIPLDPEGRYTFGLGLDTGGFLETGTVELGGRTRKLVPFGPARVLLSAGIVALLFVALNQ